MSEVEVSKDSLMNWDRGYNDRDEMAWGNAKGPYVFNKKVIYEPKKVKQKPEPVEPTVIPIVVAIPEPVPEPVVVEETVDIVLDTLPSPRPVLPDLKTLVEYLSGHFESKNQTPDQVNYYDVQLDVIPIWKKKKDDYWLYVEEATADKAAVSYRQEVFHVFKMGTLFMRATSTRAGSS